MARGTLQSVKTKGKRPAEAIESESSATPQTKRGSRSKRVKAPDAHASLRGTKAAQAVGKKVSLQQFRTEIVVPRDDENDTDHEKIIFIDNHSQEPVLALYRNKEAAVPMSHVWQSFIRDSQLVRDQVGIDTLGSFLTQEEIDAIQLINNAQIFPELVTSKGALRSKDNTAAGVNAVRQGGVFTSKSTAVTVNKADELRARAKALRTKAAAYTKQAQAYDNAATEIDSSLPPTATDAELQNGMNFLGNELPLSRKELHAHLQAHEAHLIAVAEKIRGEMSPLAIYISRAEKRIREQIQLKMAADLKLLRDIKRFGKFELQAWQIGALPQETHACKCSLCQLIPDTRTADKSAQYVFDSDFPEGNLDDVLPRIKLEPDDGDAIATTTNDNAQPSSLAENTTATANDNAQPSSLAENTTATANNDPQPSSLAENTTATANDNAQLSSLTENTTATANNDPQPSSLVENTSTPAANIDATATANGDAQDAPISVGAESWDSEDQDDDGHFESVGLDADKGKSKEEEFDDELSDEENPNAHWTPKWGPLPSSTATALSRPSRSLFSDFWGDVAQYEANMEAGGFR